MMKKIFYSILIFAACSIAAMAGEPQYMNNREPLVQKPYMELPLGSIKAEGWLKEMLLRQVSGATGRMDVLYPEVMGERNGWLGGDGDQWERGPYWIDGLLPLAYILDDEALKAKVQPWVEWALASQREDGFFGPAVDYPRESGLQRNNSHDWWPRMVMLKILQQYYSATGDKRVIGFMTRYFKYQLETLPEKPLGHWTYWARYRVCDNLQAVYWLYNITSDEFLLDLGNLLHGQGFDFLGFFENGGLQKFRSIHCVNLAQGIKEPAVYWQYSADPLVLEALENGFSQLRAFNGQPQGMYGGDEHLHGGNPTQGSELCTAIELMYSLEKIMEITGNTCYADHLERIAFNALPTQITDDFMYKQYFQQPNQVSVSRVRGNFYEDDSHMQTDIVFGTLSGFPCCFSNMHQGWPKFTANLWFATAEGGAAAMIYAPSVVTMKVGSGREITIKEDTAYPMDETIRFTVSMKGRGGESFPLMLRIPGWCKRPVISVNGEEMDLKREDGMVEINRTWSDGDYAELTLPMDVTVSRWYDNSAVMERGPLVYALALPEQWEKRSFSAEERTKFGSDYYVVTSDGKWNYGLMKNAVDNPSENVEVIIDREKLDCAFFWNMENAPIKLKVKAKEIPYWTEYNGQAGPIPLSIRNMDTPVEELELIPYGCSTLRITEFPVVR